MSRQPGLFETEAAAPPKRRVPGAGDVRPARDSPLLEAPLLPVDIRLGTSSWFFPGWRSLVYDGVHRQVTLSRKGLAAYAEIPLLRTVSLDRTFYAPISTADYVRYASQVPEHFSFVVKAPAIVCDAVMRDEEGRGKVANSHFLDAAVATREFVVPCLEGLKAKAGPLVFQVSPLPRSLVEDSSLLIERLEAFFAALPTELGGRAPLYALELRNPELLTPRLMRMLGRAGVRYCVGLHDRMPEVERQEAALKALDGGEPGPPLEPAPGFPLPGRQAALRAVRQAGRRGWGNAPDPGPDGRRSLQGRPQGLDHGQQQGRGERTALAPQTGAGNRQTDRLRP